jgi:hypothetical protein
MGIAAGVLFGGALTTWVSWQWIFWINVPVGIGVLIARSLVLPTQAAGRVGMAQLDLPGGIAIVGRFTREIVAGSAPAGRYPATSPVRPNACANRLNEHRHHRRGVRHDHPTIACTRYRRDRRPNRTAQCDVGSLAGPDVPSGSPVIRH